MHSWKFIFCPCSYHLGPTNRRLYNTYLWLLWSPIEDMADYIECLLMYWLVYSLTLVYALFVIFCHRPMLFFPMRRDIAKFVLRAALNSNTLTKVTRSFFPVAFCTLLPLSLFEEEMILVPFIWLDLCILDLFYLSLTKHFSSRLRSLVTDWR